MRGGPRPDYEGSSDEAGEHHDADDGRQGRHHHGRRIRHGRGGRAQVGGEGYKVAILSSSGKGEALAKELGGLGVTGSNQSNDDLKRLVDAAHDAWGRVDALINSAGHGPRAPVLELSDEDWHKGMEVYFLNVVRPTRLVTPLMVAQGGGSIVNISTYATFEPDPLFPTSGVFRSGLAAFTKLFADRYAADNVRMNNVLPGSSTACRKPRSAVPAFPCSATARRRRWPS